jgi:alkanesulfonate monooxygenase SsuD/methylene tetrahydromethanopterin reductase-like flavin-dependent oxidoreductase (luciferase family)
VTAERRRPTGRPEIGVYLPQLGFSFEEILHRAQRCEDLGIESMWFYDHLMGPGMPDYPSLEAWTLATAVLARTQRLRVGHMVLCNTFRHPVTLAKMATTLDQISGGRLSLGLGSGSIEDEHRRAGLPWGSAGERSARLAETLEILHQAFTVGRVDAAGVTDMPIVPGPAQARLPIVLGGVGPRYTLPLVVRYADVWNVPTYALADLGSTVARVRALCEEHGRDPATLTMSVEAVAAIAPDEASLPAVRARAEKRFGAPGFGLHDTGLIGTPEMVADKLRALVALGFGQIVLFTHDRASDETLDLLAGEVVPLL